MLLYNCSHILFQGKKNKLSRSGKSTNSTPTKGSAYFADVVDDDTDSRYCDS